MPSQQVEIAETIAALRRACDRERRGSARKPIYAATNRGNKLYRGADHVRSGTLAYTYGPERYKEKIDHAGYTRYILDRNPARYDEDGNELEESEEDEAADADAAGQNPYSGILLEELLCPLKHPSELATHPSLSKPFLDPALTDMVRSTDRKLQQERVNLWRAKNLHRQFVGDLPWVPCEAIEADEDWDMFEPRSKSDNHIDLAKSASDAHVNGIDDDEAASNAFPDSSQRQVNGGLGVQGDGGTAISNAALEGKPPPVNIRTQAPGLGGAKEETYLHEQMEATPSSPKPNGETKQPKPEDELQNISEEKKFGDDNTIRSQENRNGGAEEESSESPATPPQPTRRITRALAANVNGSNAPTPPLSPTSTLTDSSRSSLLQVDPLFLLPESLVGMDPAIRRSSRLSSISGLAADETSDIRTLLTMYIQKQEESVRGYESVLGKLIKAKRMRDEILEACKAEGHIGEMSDGEDWIDHQKWGLAPGELRKGKDEDDEAGEEREVTGIGGRKGKRRRN